MANSKNTIQNIPLEGELCMNSLKTEVKQFQGYNEKNTTFYGGTLSPIYDKTTELFNKNNSYTVFNSKGVPYTIVNEYYQINSRQSIRVLHLYKGESRIQDFTGYYGSKTEKLNVPSDTILAAKYSENGLLYISKTTGKIVLDGSTIASHDGAVIDARAWIGLDRQLIIITVGEDYFNVYHVELTHRTVISKQFRKSLGETAFISGHWLNRTDESFKISIIPSEYFTDVPGILTEQVLNRGVTAYEVDIDPSSEQPISMENTNIVDVEEFFSDFSLAHVSLTESNLYSINVQQFATRKLKNNSGSGSKYLYSNGSSSYGLTGHNGYDVGCPLGVNDHERSIYYQGGSVISIGMNGLPIDSCLSYSSNVITRCLYPHYRSITYKKNDGNWYCYVNLYTDYHLFTSSEQMQFVLDNRYIIFRNNNSVLIYDIETDEIRPERCLDWIISNPPLAHGTEGDNTTTGIVFGGGINAGYMVNNSPFVGYLPNPFVLEDFPAAGEIQMEQSTYYLGLGFYRKFPCVQNYYSRGDTVQSAKYFGKEAQYQGTVYPIDPNGNIVLPMSATSKLISGYSNNDLVKEGNTVYPLMYYNNTQKTYTYMLLSGMENITNAFSLQGQQYTVDDDNIYAVSFNAGVIQSVTSAAYKKNLTFLGTLPTQAVFWSDFNKTFYAFTGDRILSRMFEASDINKIEYVGQNPATLSLWICTDDGIYVLSDKDMFKLDYNSKQVAFYSKNALIVTEGATNNECHAISLYLNDDEQGEMIPVKLQTAYYGLGSEQKAVMDCWYLRLFDKDRTEGYVKVKVNTITDVTRHTEEKTFNISPSDYDDNNIFYLRYQPKYQECVAMQLELETNLGIYSMSLGVNTTDSTAQVSKFNF